MTSRGDDPGIRPANLQDASAIAAIHIQAWQAAYRDVFPADFLQGLSVPKRTEFWQRELNEQRNPVWVATEGGVIAGWVSGGASRDRDAAGVSEVYAVYLAPDRWRRGIGRRLMNAIEAQLPADQDITLWVLDRNHGAIGFYRSLGYEPDGSAKPGELAGVTITEVRLRKKRRIGLRS